MQMFFATRSAARATKFGKLVDNGANTQKRWARAVSATASAANVTTAVNARKRTVKVITKKSRKVVAQ